MTADEAELRTQTASKSTCRRQRNQTLRLLAEASRERDLYHDLYNYELGSNRRQAATIRLLKQQLTSYQRREGA